MERNERNERMLNQSITKDKNILNGMNMEEELTRKQAIEMN